MANSVMTEWMVLLGNRSFALAACAVGRALDFATTWVGLDSGQAAEEKLGAAQIFGLLGHHTGLIAYELGLTTPVIFLGCKLARMSVAARRRAGRTGDARLPAENPVLYCVGLVSFLTALHNLYCLF